MSDSVKAVIIIILGFILLWAFGILFMRLTFKRTVRKLLVMFREAQAFSPETAKYLDEIGIREKPLLHFEIMRDYSPQILEMLIKENIVQMTEVGKIYLSEQALAEHQLGCLDN